jgi:hypothetical protein
MKFEEYVTYLKEGPDISEEINVAEHVNLNNGGLAGFARYTIEDTPNYATTKEIIFNAELKVSNMGKKSLTFTALAGSTGNTKEMVKALLKIKAAAKNAADSYLATIMEAFTENGFQFVTKSELKALVDQNTHAPAPEHKEEKTEEKETDEWDELGDI